MEEAVVYVGFLWQGLVGGVVTKDIAPPFELQFFQMVNCIVLKLLKLDLSL